MANRETPSRQGFSALIPNPALDTWTSDVKLPVSHAPKVSASSTDSTKQSKTIIHQKHHIWSYVVFFVVANTMLEMRRHVSEMIRDSESEELLTTGEAAALLGSSRQHVVDLCEAGDLPYARVGTHRRIRRADLEAHRTGTVRLTRDQRRSLRLAHAVAGKIVSDPQAHLAVARENLTKLRSSARGRAVTWLDEWERLFDRPLHELLDALTSMSPKSRELRQNSPFAGVLSDDERRRVLEAWTDHEATGR